VTTVSTPLCVLIVDDDNDIRELLVTYLSGQGISAREANCEVQLKTQLTKQHFDVILLDINLGAEDGFAIARRLRQHWHGGLLMVSGRGDMVDKVCGLELGADDYICKPFELRELLARVRSVSRRTSQTPAMIHSTADKHPNVYYAFDRYVLDIQARELQTNTGTPVSLTTGEFDLLCALLKNAGRVLSRDQLLMQTHRREAAPFDRTIDVQIGRLRKKLNDDRVSPKIIKAVRGAGYQLTATVVIS
jgi:two-component system, OmpR family, response regulator